MGTLLVPALSAAPCLIIWVLIEKNDNFTKGNRRAQGTVDIRPSGGARVTARCPHAPVTLHCRACGRCRDALPGHYLCFCSDDKCADKANTQAHQPGRYHPGVHTHTHIAGGSSLPSAQGIFPKAVCARGARMRAGLFGGCSGLLQPVWVRVGLCGPCSPRQGRAPLCPHKPTRKRGGQ